MRVLCRVVDEARLEAILEKLAVSAERGQSWAMSLLLAYYAGKPLERHELTGAGGEPLAIRIDATGLHPLD